MNTYVDDLQTVGETSAVLFSMPQQGAVSAQATLENVGANTVNYVFQSFNGSAWSDMGDLGTDYNNTLVAGQIRMITLASAYPQVRLMGNASGGSTLNFGLTRKFNRVSGGAVPLIGGF